MIKVEIEQDSQVPEIRWLKASYNNGMAWSLIEIRSYEDALQIISALQQSVHLTGGIQRDFQALSTGEQNPATEELPTPPASR